MNVINSLFIYLLFPGFLFSFILSIFVSFLDRKITARLQYRQGPPLLQPLYDFFKLLLKEVTVPKNANLLFFLSPFLSFASVVLASSILWTAIIFKKGFIGDITVFVYLLLIPSVMLILGGASSGNVIVSLGVSREIKMLLSYELPLITATLVPILNSGSLKLIEIMQKNTLSLPSILSFFVLFICLYAKSGIVPFDAPEAETEIAGGILMEFSGILLGLIKLTKQVFMSLFPAFLVGLYFFDGGVVSFVIKYLMILFFIIIFKNINPRLKIIQVMKFFWFIIFPLSLLSVILLFIL
ncbi:MAG: complex I subunit 1 family protein [Elusimicrobiota bacterium]|nr:NADH-quinone oxidoreductase subunit H [Endomicrobiia bacterium]MDW8164924.1 complex I subunit 1 family protein [Elusimicrobiota bacterium]